MTLDWGRQIPRLTNAALAALWAGYAWRRLDLWQQTGEWVLLALVARNTLIPGPALEDPAVPPDGGGFLYLVAGRDTGGGGPGSWGRRSDGVERAVACP